MPELELDHSGNYEQIGQSAGQDQPTSHSKRQQVERPNARSPCLLQESKRRATGAAQRAGLSNPSQQKPRRNFSKHQVQILQSWFDNHINDPYPNEEEVNESAALTGLTTVQVSGWFTRYRKRKWNKAKVTSTTLIPFSGEQFHYLPDDSATQVMAGADRVIVRDKPLDPIMEVENPSASVQELRHESRSPLETYLHTPPRDEGFPRLTATNLQNDTPHFSIYNPDHNTVRGQSTFPSTRTGVERTNQPASQQFGQSVLSNDATGRPKQKKGRHLIQSRPAARKRQGDKKFQCTLCNRGYRYQSDWARHEEVHTPQRKWICMLDGPQVFSKGDRTCAFCGEIDPTDEHFTTNHNALLCFQKPEEQREFNRLDGITRHMKDSHNASIQTPPSAWMLLTHEHDTPHFWCGFCREFLRTTWEARLDHIANHYVIDDYDMTLWASEPSIEREILNESFMFSSAANPEYDGDLEMDFDNPANLVFDGATNAATSNFDAAADLDLDDAETPGFDGAPHPDFDNPINIDLDAAINADIDSIGNTDFAYPDFEASSPFW